MLICAINMLSSVTFSLAVMKVKKIHEPSKKTKQASALNKAVVKKYNKEISSYKIKVIYYCARNNQMF